MTPRLDPSISVITPTFNRSAIVERTIQHLAEVDYPKDRYELIVADNSSDDTPEVVESLARTAPMELRLIRTDERLPAVKRNLALRDARGDLVVFINDDLWVKPDFLSQHAATHGSFSEPIAVVGFVEQSSKMEQTPFVQWYRPFAFHEIADRSGRQVPYLYFWSMNLSLPRNEMLDRGLVFHEDWANIGHEDIELGYRWERAGRRLIYNPLAAGEHFHPHTLDSACRLQESIGRGLRDLEWLVPEPRLLERYGVFSWRSSPRAVFRGLARRTLFNRVTVPPLQRWIGVHQPDSRIVRWLYWKIMLLYTNRGYRRADPRKPERLATGPPTRSEGL